MPTDQGHEILLELQPYKAECYSLTPSLCLLAKSGADANYSFFFDVIEGFEYEWGHHYELRVLATHIANPPADGSSVAYRLLEQLSRQAVAPGSRFDFSSAWAPELITKHSSGLYVLGYDTTFQCQPTLCDSLDDLLSQGMSLLLEFSYADPSSDVPLALEQIKCSDTEPGFRQSCMPESS